MEIVYTQWLLLISAQSSTEPLVLRMYTLSAILEVVLEREPGSGSIHLSAYGCIAPAIYIPRAVAILRGYTP